MNLPVGAFNDHPPILPDLGLTRSEAQRRTFEAVPSEQSDQRQIGGLAAVLPFPYQPILRSLVEQGRILEARKLLDAAGNFVPQDSKIRKVLAPPGVRKSERKDSDRSAEFRWLRRNSSNFRGKWVALLGDDLVHQSDSFKELLAHLDTLDLPAKPLLHHID